MAPISLPHTFTRRQAIDLGVSDFRLRGMVLRDEVVKLRTGVYTRREAATPDSRAAHHLDRARAALDHYTTGFVASHLTAAAAHGLPLPLGPTGDVHLMAVAAVQQSRRAPGVAVPVPCRPSAWSTDGARHGSSPTPSPAWASGGSRCRSRR